MDPVLTLLGLSLAMLVGCYLAGVIPLAVTLSEEKLKLVTVLGAGLLVGTALAVIIPEGVHALGTHSHHAEQLSVRSIDKPAIPGQPVPGEKLEKLAEKQQEKNEETEVHQHEHSENDGHSVIGVALVTGFIFMLLVDQIGGSHMKSSTDTSQLSIQNRNKLTATVGLVVHAAADGIALGAAITLAQTHLTLIVFIAIMLHKAPAAFGLVSFLLHEGFDRPRIRKHLLIFSLAAPVLAILTYMALSQQSRETLSNMNTTGIAMLFSAGTFLYVATVHVLPEISTGQSKVTSLDGTVVLHEHKGFRSIELIALVIGAVIPVILAAGHKH